MSAILRRLRERGRETGPLHVTALDIGTAVAKALVVEIGGDGTGVVVGVGRQPQGFAHMEAGTVTDIAAVVDTCAVALQEAEEMAGLRPATAVVGIAGELVRGATTEHAIERADPARPIDERELVRLVEEAQRRARAEAEARIADETGTPGIDVRLVHGAIVAASVDGHPVRSPVGFRGRHLRVAVFDAFAPLVHLGALEAVAEGLDLELLDVVAEPFAVARLIDPGELGRGGALVVDVGGGTTDVALVERGGLVATRMLGIGGRAFTRSIADALGIPLRLAEARKIDHARGLPVEEAGTIEASLRADAATWRTGLALMLEELAGSGPLPDRLLLCGGGSLLPQLGELLEDPATWRPLPVARPPRVERLVPAAAGLADATGLLADPADVTPAALAAHALALAAEPDPLEAALRRVLRATRLRGR